MMPLLRRRPLVFVSSTIAELRLPREEIKREVSSLGLVDEWLFEFHAVAAGATPDVQYLNLATNCDVFVLIVAQEMSDATYEEYERAYADNPHKILAFYIGGSNAEVEAFRSTVDSRHSRTELDDESRLVAEVARAVEEAVLTARLVVPELKGLLHRRIERLDALVGLEPPMSFIPFCQVGYRDPERLVQALTRNPRLALIGMGGSGKTYSCLAALASYADDGFNIPLYLRAVHGVLDPASLIEHAFDEARFQPGNDLITRYCREGRLVLCVDAVDDLNSDDRARLLSKIDAFSDRFPRVKLITLTRSLEPNSLPGFERGTPSPLSEMAIAQLFELHGYKEFQVHRDLPRRIRDLAERPFWAALLATVGTDSETGLVLLERLVSRRLAVAIPEDELRRQKLRLVLGRMALKARPGNDLGMDEAIREVAEMWCDRAIAQEQTPEPADQLVDAARATGLVDADRDRLTFVHPLVATTLAAHFGPDPFPLTLLD